MHFLLALQIKVCYNYNIIQQQLTHEGNMQNLQNNTKIKTVTTLEEGGVQLEIDCTKLYNYSVNGHVVESITMWADTDCIGDLAVNWKYQ